MNQIELSVGGRQFAIAVQPGDEDHVRKLGEQINERFQQLANRYSQNLLFASLRIADELHAAEAKRAKIEADSQSALEGMADLKRETELSEGKVEKLKERISSLEKELDRAQTALQQESNKYNDLIADNERFKVAVMEADSENSGLKAELATAKRERDLFETKLEEAASQEPTAPSFIDPATASDDPDLVPSLERFADLLENCVTKLEGTAEAS